MKACFKCGGTGLCHCVSKPHRIEDLKQEVEKERLIKNRARADMVEEILIFMTWTIDRGLALSAKELWIETRKQFPRHKGGKFEN